MARAPVRQESCSRTRSRRRPRRSPRSQSHLRALRPPRGILVRRPAFLSSRGLAGSRCPRSSSGGRWERGPPVLRSRCCLASRLGRLRFRNRWLAPRAPCWTACPRRAGSWIPRRNMRPAVGRSRRRSRPLSALCGVSPSTFLSPHSRPGQGPLDQSSLVLHSALGTQPQVHVSGLHRLADHPHEALSEPVEVRLVPQGGREGFQGLSRIVVAAVEASVYKRLDAAPQGCEQGGYNQRGCDDGELGLLLLAG